MDNVEKDPLVLQAVMDEVKRFAKFIEDRTKGISPGHPQDKESLQDASTVFRLSFDQLVEHCESPRQIMNIRMLMASAYLMGQAGTLSDAARDYIMAPLRDSAQKGGRQSGETRRHRAQKWQEIATPEINKLLDTNPGLSQDDLAHEVKAGWKHRTPRAPGLGTLRALAARIKNARKISDNVLKFK